MAPSTAVQSQKARSGEMPGREVGKEWRLSQQALLGWLEGDDRSQTPV